MIFQGETALPHIPQFHRTPRSTFFGTDAGAAAVAAGGRHLSRRNDHLFPAGGNM